MILDKIQNRSLYESIHRNFGFAFDMIENAIKKDLPAGKYVFEDTSKVKEGDLWISVQEYETRPRAEKKFEGHRDYIDIQFIVSGHEAMEVCDVTRMEEKTEYDAVKDVQFFSPKGESSVLALQAGDWAIFFPDDIHMPGVSPEGENVAVKKIVAKVKIL
jgi:YhcH/YjgK/YiaL family protein